MAEDRRIHDLILRMKSAKAEQCISIQTIVDKCEQNGTPVGKTSVARIFSEGSENLSFRYEATIKPVAQCLLGVEDPLHIPEPVDREALLDKIQRQREQELKELKERYIRQIAEKEAEIKRLRISSRYRTIAIIILGALLILFMAIAIGYLAWDLTHPTRGAFQWETAAFLR